MHYITPGVPFTHRKQLQQASNVCLSSCLQHACSMISGVNSDVNRHKDKAAFKYDYLYVNIQICEVQAGSMGYSGQKETHTRRHLSERIWEERKEEKDSNLTKMNASPIYAYINSYLYDT